MLGRCSVGLAHLAGFGRDYKPGLEFPKGDVDC